VGKGRGREKDGKGAQRGGDDKNGDSFDLLHCLISFVQWAYLFLGPIKRVLKRDDIPDFVSRLV
jgi:hypothetical protein